MSEIKIGLQSYSVREAFADDPVATIKRIKQMGYKGMEIQLSAILGREDGKEELPAEFYKKALHDEGLECYGLLASWWQLEPDKIKETIQYNKDIGSPFLVISAVSPDLIKNIDDVNKHISYMNELYKIITAEGIVTGYHNHASDFTTVIEGKTFFEHVFDNTPHDFVMLLDTGNAKAGGYDAIELLKKYPGRSPFLHIKGYSEKDDYLARIGYDDYDWEELIDCAVNIGKTTVFDIEFGKRGDYDPLERAEDGYKVIKPMLDRVLNK